MGIIRPPGHSLPTTWSRPTCGLSYCSKRSKLHTDVAITQDVVFPLFAVGCYCGCSVCVWMGGGCKPSVIYRQWQRAAEPQRRPIRLIWINNTLQSSLCFLGDSSRPQTASQHRPAGGAPAGKCFVLQPSTTPGGNVAQQAPTVTSTARFLRLQGEELPASLFRWRAEFSDKRPQCLETTCCQCRASLMPEANVEDFKKTASSTKTNVGSQVWWSYWK